MLANRRTIITNTVIINIQPTNVASMDTYVFVVAVTSDKYPHIIQHNVAILIKISTSVEFVPHVTATTNNMIVAVILYSIHRIPFRPRSTPRRYVSDDLAYAKICTILVINVNNASRTTIVAVDTVP